MNQNIQQIQQQKASQQRMLEKANFLVQGNRVRRSTCKESRNIWMVGSYSTSKKWYVVKWSEDIDGFVCACKAFEYSSEGTCFHVLACAIFEGENQ